MKSRKSLSLADYDYSAPGHYFITFNLKVDNSSFGIVKNNTMYLNNYGQIADLYWKLIPFMYKNVLIDDYVIMPDHIHGIIEITEQPNVVTEHCSVTTLSTIVKSYKGSVTKHIRKSFNDFEFKWQRSFYDRIIETDEELENVRWYIESNPDNY